MVDILIRGGNAETAAVEMRAALRDIFGVDPIPSSRATAEPTGTRGLVELATLVRGRSRAEGHHLPVAVDARWRHRAQPRAAVAGRGSDPGQGREADTPAGAAGTYGHRVSDPAGGASDRQAVRQ